MAAWAQVPPTRVGTPRLTRPVVQDPDKPDPPAVPPTPEVSRSGMVDLPLREEVELPFPNRGLNPQVSPMWMNGHMTIVLASGAVEGSVVQRGREKTIEVMGLEHVVEGDAYGLVRLTIGADQSIPDLLGAMGQSGQGATATITFYGANRLGNTGSAAGVEIPMFTMVLEGVRVERVRLTRNMSFNEIGLGYDKITYRSDVTGHQASATR